MNQVDAMTERLLDEAGVGPGMRVLDVGCGAGAVAFMAARRVGEDGAVVGVDRDVRALAVGRERAREVGHANVTFVEGDFGLPRGDFGLPQGEAGEMGGGAEAPFDVAIGRRVLMYQPDALAAVKRLARDVRPGGVIAFHEHDATIGPLARSPLPLHARVHEWMWRTVASEGANIHLGFELASLLARAGLDLGGIHAEAVVQTPETDYPVAAIVRAMLPRMIAHGVVTEAEADVGTLDARLRAERRDAGATYIGELVFLAWARTPPDAATATVR